MEIPDQIDWHAQHCDIGEHVENGRSEIEGVDIQATACFFGVPDLTARRAKENRDEEEDDVEDAVDRDKEMGEPVADVSLDRAEDTEDEQHN